jgi:2'-5' RNA ligase
MKNYYLAWPMKLKIRSGGLKHVHLTLKYIGQLDVAPDTLSENIIDSIKGISTKLDLSFCVISEKYEINPKTLAIILETMPVNLATIRNAVEHLASNDYAFWPHITLPRGILADEARELIMKKNTDDLLVEIGDLTLYVDKKPYRTF